MDAVLNPFVPGAGTPPPELAGRDDILNRARVTLARTRDRRSPKSFLLIGLRGVGKTVLLNRVNVLAEDLGFKSVIIEAHENKRLPALLVPPLRQILLSLDRFENVSAQVKRSLRILKGFVGALRVSVGEIEVGLDLQPEPGVGDSGDLETDLPELLLAVAQSAADRKIPVSLIIDEMQYLSEQELSALIMGMHKIAQRQLPFVLIGAGLPQLVGLSGRSKSYAERLFDFPTVGQLSYEDACNALQEPVQKENVEFTSDALMEIILTTQGYPYFLQEWGYHSWNCAALSPICFDDVRAATISATRSLDESFFRVRFDRLTPREKEYLSAMSQLGAGPHRSGDIAEILETDVRSVAPLRNGLIKKGMIYSPSHGDTAFTVPLFDEFMNRTMR